VSQSLHWAYQGWKGSHQVNRVIIRLHQASCVNKEGSIRHSCVSSVMALMGVGGYPRWERPRLAAWGHMLVGSHWGTCGHAARGHICVGGMWVLLWCCELLFGRFGKHVCWRRFGDLWICRQGACVHGWRVHNVVSCGLAAWGCVSVGGYWGTCGMPPASGYVCMSGMCVLL
jgi:hypothetical protein